MHFALVKKIWGPFFDHFVDLQILTIWGQRSGSDRLCRFYYFTSKLLRKTTKIGIGTRIAPPPIHTYAHTRAQH